MSDSLLPHLLINPAGGGGHTGVHGRHVPLPTADAPGDNPRLVPGAVPLLADQGAAPVPFAGVHPLHPASTHEAGVQLEELSQPRVLPQVLLALLVADHRDHDLLQDLLVLPAGPELVFAPAVADTEVWRGGRTARLGQTDGTDVVHYVKLGAQHQQSKVVVVVLHVQIRVFLSY